MKTWNRVAIVGVGLIGGSIGIDLLRRGIARHVVGIGRRQESLDEARDVGAVSSTSLDMSQGVRDAELVIVCTPVGRIVEDVLAAAKAAKPGTLITDAGSTKAEIVASLERAAVNGSLSNDAAFVGSHPLAGGEKTGPRAAIADLFVNRVVVVTPSAGSKEVDVRTISIFWSSLGARVMKMSAEEHDRIVAATSHLPHLVASVLAASTDAAHLPLTAGGWLDTTRIAAGDASLWQQILLSNRANVLESLQRFEQNLAVMRQAIEAGDADEIQRLLNEARQLRRRISHGSSSD
jgi:prephenate dehydrogenase